MYHLAAESVSVCWKRCKCIESSINEIDEHHKWNAITWFFGSSLGLSSNLGISDGNLARITGQKGKCNMGSFVNRDKSGRSRVARKGNCQLT
jgi:hypothetical protein